MSVINPIRSVNEVDGDGATEIALTVTADSLADEKEIGQETAKARCARLGRAR